MTGVRMTTAQGIDVLFEKGNGVATITLNRPTARNAFTVEMCSRLEQIVGDLRTDTETHVVVIQAAGSDFTVGADLKAMSSSLSPDPQLRSQDIADMARRTSVPIFTGLYALRQPIVVSVRGHAIGVGAQLALSADLCIAADNAKFLMPQARLAHPVDHGESFFLPRKIGPARSMQLLLLAETLSAQVACDYGIVNWVVPDKELAAKTAEVVGKLRAVAPVAAAEIKALLRESLSNDLSRQFEAEMRALARCAATADFPEAIQAFVEKRPPVFHGR
jgi:2-(1,2-epoxy-1,2-dihydrophenyl)acetyl-CoA isomerase